MAKAKGTPTIENQILALLRKGGRELSEIREAVSGEESSIGKVLSNLVKEGKIIRPVHGFYAINPELEHSPPAKISREESENGQTINRMLNLYDTVLDNLTGKIQSELLSTATLSENIDLIKSLRWLGATVDQLMKRWYLVHRGYDTNTRQAQEDAKAKTRQTEEEQLANAPVEQQVEVLGSFDLRTKKLIDGFPTLESLSEEEAQEKTV